MAKSIINYIPEDKFERFQEIVDAATDAKANAPRVRTERKPMSAEQKRKMAEARLAKLEAELQNLLANED